IEEWSTRVAGIDRGIGLEQLDLIQDAELDTPLGADDASGHGLTQPERTAGGQNPVAYLHLPVAVGEVGRQGVIRLQVGSMLRRQVYYSQTGQPVGGNRYRRPAQRPA